MDTTDDQLAEIAHCEKYFAGCQHFNLAMKVAQDSVHAILRVKAGRACCANSFTAQLGRAVYW